jgi:predicted acyltransferase
MADDSSPQSLTESPQRLVFLDVVRGLTVAFMILVNNNGSEEVAYWPLKHADWNGWTPTDLVFPIFIFLVGISIVFSTASRMARGEAKSALLMHAFRRAAIIFALGILIHGFPHYPLATLRIYGVLQRIAVCYLVASILYLWDRRVVTLVSVSVICLLGYWILVRWVPVPGFGMPGRDIPFLDKDINWVSVVDRQLFPRRLLEGTRDPLGLISTIPAIATCLLGVLTGLWLRTQKGMTAKAGGMLSGAIAGLALGRFWASGSRSTRDYGQAPTCCSRQAGRCSFSPSATLQSRSGNTQAHGPIPGGSSGRTPSSPMPLPSCYPPCSKSSMSGTPVKRSL